MDKGIIELGDRVRDVVSGFIGIVVGKSQWINGCSTSGVKSEELKDGLPTEIQWFDDPQIKIEEKNVIECGIDPGGPVKNPKQLWFRKRNELFDYNLIPEMLSSNLVEQLGSASRH